MEKDRDAENIASLLFDLKNLLRPAAYRAIMDLRDIQRQAMECLRHPMALCRRPILPHSRITAPRPHYTRSPSFLQGGEGPMRAVLCPFAV